VGRPPKMKETIAPARSLSWEDAIQRVLADADGALHYTEIPERIASMHLRPLGANPSGSVAATIATSLGRKTSPFFRLGHGAYTLKVTAKKAAQLSAGTVKSADQVAETGALRALGMFWQRRLVCWEGTPRLLGRQLAGATDVDFAGQTGVYLLHDHVRVIYVGQAVDSLFARLKAHTTSRLSGRWDRFSWFGLRSVGDDGKLSDREVPWSQNVVVDTMEALLIESLEPPLNRRRGDNLSAANISKRQTLRSWGPKRKRSSMNSKKVLGWSRDTKRSAKNRV
jgi:hypothetical protein